MRRYFSLLYEQFPAISLHDQGVSEDRPRDQHAQCREDGAHKIGETSLTNKRG